MAPRAHRRRNNDRDDRRTELKKAIKLAKRADARRICLRYLLPAAIVFVISFVVTFIYLTKRYPSPSSSVPVDLGGLELSYKTVLSEHGISRVDTTRRYFNNSVLAYVTPWNNKGYDFAKKYRQKLTHVSPVWYQLKCGESTELEGRHDIDQNWIKDVRIKGRPAIVPRITLEGWHIDAMLAHEDEIKHGVSIISTECKSMGYDGIVLEAWNIWGASGILSNPILRQKALHFVRELGITLHRNELPRPNRRMQLIFVIPPPSDVKDPKQFTAADMKFLGKAVDGFSLMTYDYSSPHRPGPNAPLPWIETCLKLLLGEQNSSNPEEHSLTSKILTGLNFYGNDYNIPQGGGPIIGHEYISMLKKLKPTLQWEEKSKEHYFLYNDGKRHVVYYPTLRSLAVRLDTARKWGTGISIWEIGQGLEYFFDLF